MWYSKSSLSLPILTRSSCRWRDRVSAICVSISSFAASSKGAAVFSGPGPFTFHNTLRNLHPGFLKGHHNPGKPSNKFKTTEEINEITSQVCSLSIRSGPFPLTLHPFCRGAHSSCLVLWWRLPPPTLEWHRTNRVIWLDGVGAFSLRARSTVMDARRGRTCRSTAPAPELSQSTAQVH